MLSVPVPGLGAQEAEGAPAVQFDELARHKIPNWLQPAGAALSQSGNTAVLWGDSGIVIVTPAGQTHTLRLALRGARFASDTVLEVVQAPDQLARISLPRKGEPLPAPVVTNTLPRTTRAVEIARCAGKWWGYHFDGNGDLLIEPLADDEGGWSLPAANTFSYMKGAATTLLVTQEDRPFGVTRIDCVDGGTSTFEIPESDNFLFPGLWKSLPTIAIPGGYVQTVADLRSGDRVLFRYDAAGRLVSSLTLPGLPMGLVASTERIVAAIQDVGGTNYLVLLQVTESNHDG